MSDKTFRMIDNYIYLYHTKTLVVIPTYPEQLQDSMEVEFSSAHPLSRSAPIFSYVKSGPRSVQVSLSLHRDMLNEINIAESKLNVKELAEADYVDVLINNLQSMALPRYAAAEKMVDPPLIAVRFGNQLFIKGVVTSGITVTYKKPILSSGSTDCNIPYSLGIPGCCFGGYIGKGEHTKELENARKSGYSRVITLPSWS